MANHVNNDPDEKEPDAANSYERSRPKEQSPSGKLDQPEPPVLEKQDSQEAQNESPEATPKSWKQDKPRAQAGQD